MSCGVSSKAAEPGSLQVDRVAARQLGEQAVRFGIRLRGEADEEHGRIACIAQPVPRHAGLFVEEGVGEWDQAVDQLFQGKSVAAEDDRRQEDDEVGIVDGLRQLGRRIACAAAAGGFRPALEVAEAGRKCNVGQRVV